MQSELRVVMFQEPEETVGIYEVYLDDEGQPVSFASQPVTMKWTGNPTAILGKLDEMRQAVIMKKWLTPKDFGLPQ